MPYSLRRLLIGSPFPTSRMQHERLGPIAGLAVFASDALSSVAYATEEILLALVLAGTAGLPYTLPIGFAIGVLILIVATSYRQTVLHYPEGGGAYIVAHDNLGITPGLIAAAALLTDYVLTVAVSVTAGIAAVISAFPELLPYRVGMSIFVIAFVALMNLRGVRESGIFFAIPTYMFIFSLLTLLGAGVYRAYAYGMAPSLPPEALPAHQALSWFLVLRAFSSGCAALTGIEAVANGVQAFREPASKNAAKVLTALAILLFVMFLGITWLSRGYAIVPQEHETVVSQVARTIFGRNWMYYIIQAATSVILFLAANTSFAGFPRLASLLARDGYLPRQLANLGDRLVFNNGIILLAVSASALVIIFGGKTHALIPLYAVGVFLAFTLSQTGMVVRWWRRREPGWPIGILINSVGALTTFVVLSIILATKFVHGAWIIALLLPLLVLEFRRIKRHYEGVARLLRLDKIEKLPVRPTTVIVPVAGLHKGVLQALRFALGLNCPVEAVHVAVSDEAAEKLKEQWEKLEVGIPLHILSSPYRSLTGPLLEYVDSVLARDPEAFVAIVIPEFVPQHWLHAALHNQSAMLLQFALRSRPRAVLISIRYLLGEALHAQQKAEEAAPIVSQAEEAPPAAPAPAEGTASVTVEHNPEKTNASAAASTPEDKAGKPQ